MDAFRDLLERAREEIVEYWLPTIIFLVSIAVLMFTALFFVASSNDSACDQYANVKVSDVPAKCLDAFKGNE